MSRHLHHRRQHEHHHRGHDVRDSLGVDPLKDRILSAIKQDASDVATVVSVVYKTASQTFEGSIGGYITMTSTLPQTIQVQAPTPSTAQTSQAPPPDTTTQQLPTTTPRSEPATIPSSAASPISLTSTLVTSHSATAKSPDSSTLQSISTVPVFSADAGPTPPSASAAAQSSAKASSSDAGGVATEKSSSGLSGGTKAGIAIGVLLGIGLLLGLLFFCYRRRKNQEHGTEAQVENEKNPFGDNAAIPAATVPVPAPALAPQHVPSRVSTPPQLSLRPVTQFQPELLGRGERAADVLGITGPAMAAATIVQQADRPTNPFEDRATGSPPVTSAGPLSSNSSKSTAREIPAPLRIKTPTPESDAGVVTAQRHNAPKPLEIKRTASPGPTAPMVTLDAAIPSPAATEFSMTSVSATSITSGPGAMNVHRIQLDFKPSMDDELELRAGQLVRLLHEYDDGWALCIRLDRSQQGVAPRTCLSTRPVKPRAKGPPRNGTPDGPRFTGAAAQNGRPSSPLAERSTRPVAPVSPAVQRSGPPALSLKTAEQASIVPNATSSTEASPVKSAAEVFPLQPSVQRKPVGNQSP